MQTPTQYPVINFNRAAAKCNGDRTKYTTIAFLILPHSHKHFIRLLVIPVEDIYLGKYSIAVNLLSFGLRLFSAAIDNNGVGILFKFYSNIHDFTIQPAKFAFHPNLLVKGYCMAYLRFIITKLLFQSLIKYT